MEFVCPDPNATVRAANVNATLAAFKLLPELGRRIVVNHGLALDQLTPDHFIRVQDWLDALKEIQQLVGPSKLRAVGRNIIEAADFPPHFTDATKILEALDAIYYMNHRGDVGHYVVKRLPDGAIEVRCETPYPRMFERGLVEGICAHKRAGGRFLVEYAPGPDRGDVTCTLTVRRV